MSSPGEAHINPFTGATLYIDADSKAAMYCSRHPGTPEAEAVRQIALQPQAIWLETADAADHARSVLANARGALVIFTIYYIPKRDNGGYSRGGAPDAAHYGAFIDAVAEACVAAAPVFILEPDALVSLDGCSPPEQRLRCECLAYALDKLSAAGPVYLDVGHPAWQAADAMARRFAQLGTTRNRGFALNVSNFQTDAANIAYAQQLFALTGKPSVIDTSRNGNGPHPDGIWCNPPKRSLGQRPLALFPSAAVDANLWIKRPGESDGTDNNGPEAGEFWPEYAASLGS